MAENEQANENESSVIKELRKQIKDRDERLSKLEPMARESAFKEAGIDVESGPGKFFAEKYDGELSAEAIREAAEPYGFVGEQQQAAEEQAPSGPDEQQQRMGELRSASTPEGAGQRMSHRDWLALSKTDPTQAQDAFANGMVDLPSHIAQATQAS